jgi:glycerophosphoryl diester phosphodiesterase
MGGNHLMKKVTLLFLLVALLISHPVQAQNLRSVLLENELIICVHRAAVGPDVTENSISGMEIAKKAGFVMHEIDLRESKDGELFLMHDVTLDRTTMASGVLSNYAAKELEEIQLKGSEEPIPSFTKALEWAGENEILLMLDVKNVSLKKVYEEVLKANMLDRVFLLTFTEERSKEALSLEAELMVSVLINSPEDIQKYQEYAQSPVQLLAYINKRAGLELFERVHESGIPIITDTLNDIDTRALNHGAQVYLDFISNRKPTILVSDYPIMVRQALQ